MPMPDRGRGGGSRVPALFVAQGPPGAPLKMQGKAPLPVPETAGLPYENPFRANNKV